jgi:hypothetical protein
VGLSVTAAELMTVNVPDAVLPEASVTTMMPAPGPALPATVKVAVKAPVGLVVPMPVDDEPASGVNVKVTGVFMAKPDPVTVTVVPAGPFDGLTVMAGTTLKMVAALLPLARPLAKTVAAPGPALPGTVRDAEKLPLTSVAASNGALTTRFEAVSTMVTTSSAAKPEPVTVTGAPALPLVGVTVITGVAASATPALVSAPATDPVVARGAANGIGRLLRSSAAVSMNAAKVLRSECSVPSSSER